jgi:group I intron endonuclease
MKTAVYKITNTVNKKFYVGLSAYPVARWSTHKRKAKDGAPYKIHAAMRKYGIAAFSFEVLHWCATREDANELEHFIIEECGTRTLGYNMREGGSSGSHSEESKIKIGLLGLGREVTPETRAKISKGLVGLVRPAMPEETKQKLSACNKGRVHTPEAIEKIRAAGVGRKHSNRKPQSVESRQKAAKSISETRTRKAKKVVCVETNETYPSARLAAQACGVSEALVSMHCNGKIRGGKSLKGLTFRYITMEDENIYEVPMDTAQPEFIINSVSVAADSFEPDTNFSEEV